MRLFLIGLWIVAVAACKSGEEPKAGALRVDLSYDTFRPGCVTLKAADKADASKEITEQVSLGNPPPQSQVLTVAVFRQKDWSRNLVLTATAYEGSCAVENPRQVATQTREAQVPEKGVEPVPMKLHAEDLDDDGHVRSDQGGTDCNDNDKQVNPRATEACDGKDNNCNGTVDDSFNVGQQCTMAQGGCQGTVSCQGPAASACVSSEQPKDWFVDRDGDGSAGTAAGTSCVAPEQGAGNTSTDCDDSSPFAFNGATERCDRLDNNCDNQVDEGCGARSFEEVPGTANAFWREVASYAENKAWVAGDGSALAHVEGTTVTPHTDCPGDWVSAWAHPTTGRIFLGSTTGVLATRGLSAGEACVTMSTDRNSSVNGLVGIPNGPSATLFAVTSEGRIFQWSYTGTGAGTVTLAAQVVANLRAIDGTSATNLVAVGTELVDTVPSARAFGTDPATGAWRRETLPTTLPTSVFLRGVHMTHARLAYAAGDKGVVLQRANGAWTELPRLPGAANARDVAAYGSTAVYVVSNATKDVYRYNGTTWSTDLTVSWTPHAIDGVAPHDLWVAGSQGTVIHRGP